MTQTFSDTNELTISNKVAKILIDKKAVILSPDDPFTWASGIKSPIYCDNRQLLSYPNERKYVAQALAMKIKKYYPNTTVIAGTATAGIPHAALVADILDLPMIYVRGKAKDHGRKTQIEGKLESTDNVVLIDDLISTGGSVLKAAEVVEEVASVVGVVAIFNYELQKARSNFEAAKTSLHILTNFSELLEVAEDNNYLSNREIDSVKKWRQESFQ